MKLKTVTVDGKVYAETLDGKPLYVGDDNKEIPFDAPATVGTINRITEESKRFKERAQTAEDRAKLFEGIEDAEAARKALETVANLDAGQLKTTAQVEEIKTQAKRAAEQQVADAAKASGLKITELEGKLAKMTSEFDGEKISNAFANSKFMQDKVAAPRDMVQAMFGNRFKREDGKLVAYDASGNKMYSRTKPGELAEFDEAMEMIVDAYPSRDAILKGTGANGAASTPGGQNNGGGGQKSITRSEFNKLDPVKQRETAASHTITD